MKLVDRFTLWFLGVTLLIIVPINSYITYVSIRHEIDKSAVERLKHVNQRVGEVLNRGEEPGEFTQGCRIKVVPVSDTKPADYYEITDRDVTHDPELKDNDRKITVTSWHTVNGQHFKITSGDYVTRSEQILAGLRISIVSKLIILILLLVLTARLASRIVLAPFYSTLKKLQHFNLKNKKKLALRPTRTKEFSELNTYVSKMTDKAVDDYISLKEFAENASHELQTPLAIIRSKLELLSESDIRGEQAVLISDMQNSVDKLTHINRSLVLLSRLENNEYEAREEVSLSKYTKDAMGSFGDLITLKGLHLEYKVADDVDVKLHASLVDILLNNLIGNAIRHNIPNGRIEVVLDKDCLRISNTGVPPTGNPEEMFQRFKKGTQCNHSIGIGLSIVKQICDINSFKIRYQFASSLHMVTIAFPAASNSSKLLQNDERYLHEKIQL
ncbi:sensor histidine kinase [Chitinophaga barathri]|uniref:histidine kinase n=1 Tax=Chitinophaga barathri TaxID=1647451 RepID=A0A3N4M6A4_9BACT|nr:HAMP domain-containing sensor histidine kinase [Chitinophaga barathri]RPD38678.1 sensor histidine kinase [Chitinophaga barathri]